MPGCAEGLLPSAAGSVRGLPHVLLRARGWKGRWRVRNAEFDLDKERGD